MSDHRVKVTTESEDANNWMFGAIFTIGFIVLMSYIVGGVFNKIGFDPSTGKDVGAWCGFGLAMLIKPVREAVIGCAVFIAIVLGLVMLLKYLYS